MLFCKRRVNFFKMSYKIKNSKVMKITKKNITGNVVPPSWFQHLRFEKSDKPHLPAIMILSDIIYWYRAVEKRDEETGMVVEYKQKFKADMLQKQYKMWMKLFGFGYDQTKNAVKYLEEKGLINREFRNIKTTQGETLWNRMFVEPVPEKVEEITYPCYNNNNSGKDSNREGGVSNQGGGNETSPSKSATKDKDVSKHVGGSISTQNTDSTTETTTETTTNKNNNKGGNFKKTKYSLPDPEEIINNKNSLDKKVEDYYVAHYGKNPSVKIIEYLNGLNKETACHVINFCGENSYDPPQIIKILKDLIKNKISSPDQFYKHVEKFRKKNYVEDDKSSLKELYDKGYR